MLLFRVLVVSWVLTLGLSANLCFCDLGFGFFVLGSRFEVQGLERDLGYITCICQMCDIAFNCRRLKFKFLRQRTMKLFYYTKTVCISSQMVT